MAGSGLIVAAPPSSSWSETRTRISCRGCFVSPQTYCVSKEDFYIFIEIELDVSHVAGRGGTVSSSNRDLG